MAMAWPCHGCGRQPSGGFKLRSDPRPYGPTARPQTLLGHQGLRHRMQCASPGRGSGRRWMRCVAAVAATAEGGELARPAGRHNCNNQRLFSRPAVEASPGQPAHLEHFYKASFHGSLRAGRAEPSTVGIGKARRWRTAAGPKADRKAIFAPSRRQENARKIGKNPLHNPWKKAKYHTAPR